MPNKKNGKSSAEYYRDNKDSYKKKLAAQKEINKRPEERKRRSELVQERRDRGIYGKGGKDVAHTKNGTRLKDPSTNRGSKTDMPGDRRARGGKKK